MSDYTDLLNAKRQKPSRIPDRLLEEEFESDRARILYSPAFRRLQQKAQVFSLVENPQIRARLTHSLEVSDVGRKSAMKAAAGIQAAGLLESNEVRAFILVVENACLMHDIGNPPFGHLGEAAIRSWFKASWESCFKKAMATPNQELSPEEKQWAEDFIQFDGNPQGTRIALRLQGIDVREGNGMNLTFSQILTALKYVRSPTGTKDGGVAKKPGFFLTEEKPVTKARSELKYPANKRFPPAYLVEAADDISYCISDFEDGIEVGVIDERTFFEEVDRAWQREEPPPTPRIQELDKIVKDAVAALKKGEEPSKGFIVFKTTFIRLMIETAAEAYVSKHAQVLEGTMGELLAGLPEKALVDALKDVARKKLFPTAQAEKIEIAGYHIIRSILEHYRPLLEMKQEEFAKLFASGEKVDELIARLFRRLPKNYRDVYATHKAENTSIPEWFLRAHLVVDYVSGMTDQFALRTHQLLTGVRVE